MLVPRFRESRTHIYRAEATPIALLNTINPWIHEDVHLNPSLYSLDLLHFLLYRNTPPIVCALTRVKRGSLADPCHSSPKMPIPLPGMYLESLIRIRIAKNYRKPPFIDDHH